MAELADAMVSNTIVRKGVRVRVPLRAPPRSALRTDELVKTLYVFLPSDGQIPPVHVFGNDADLLAGQPEDVHDVLRAVAEEVAGIGVGARRPVDDVCASTAIGVDKPSEKKLWVLDYRQLVLPRLK